MILEAFTDLSEFEKAVQDESAKDFKPPGKCVHSYSTRGRNYEIWAGSLGDPEVRRLLDRVQICTPLFIEAGMPLVTDDPEWTLERWMVYFMYVNHLTRYSNRFQTNIDYSYEKVTPPSPTASQYSIVGYATTYRYWLYQRESQAPTVKNDPFPLPEKKLSQLPSRLRIAQFLILPPHQGSGHGTHLYTTIHSACFNDPTIIELTVEDPNEAFDGLRDSSDYYILRPEFIKHKVNINPDPYESHTLNQRPRLVPTAALIPTKLLHDIRMSYKIAPTQFAHILEMFLLSEIPFEKRRTGGARMARLLIKKHKLEDANDRRYYWWRMLTKQRLYKRSKDMLIELEMTDRLQKLEETVDNVEDGYEILLKGFAEREEILKSREEELTVSQDKGAEYLNGTPGKEQRSKRKFTVEDDEDEDAAEGSATKRSKA